MKKSLYGKRFAALLLAAAVCVSEAAGVMAAMPAGVEQTQEAAGSVAQISGERGPGEGNDDQALSGNTVSVNTVQGTPEGTYDDEELDAQIQNFGTQGAPAAVTGVTIVTDPETLLEQDLYEPIIRWNYVPKCYWYEFLITDERGYTYAAKTEKNAAEQLQYVYPNTGRNLSDTSLPYETLRSIIGYAYQNNELVKEAEKVICPFLKGHTYSISVRAVNRYAQEITKDVYDAKEKKDNVSYEWKRETDEATGEIVTKYYRVTAYNGAWSSPVTYRPEISPTDPTVITGLKYTSQNDEVVYFTFDQTFQGGTVYYQYSTDPTFTDEDAIRLTSYAQADNYIQKIRMNKKNCNLKDATTYYVRAYYKTENGQIASDDKGNTIYSNVASFVCVLTGKLKLNMTPPLSDLRIIKTTSSAYKFAIGTVVEDTSIRYQLEYSADPNFAQYEVVTNMTISKSALKRGKVYYVRARTFDANANPRTYGTPTNIVTIRRAVSGGTISLIEWNAAGLAVSLPAQMNQGDRFEYWISTDPAFPNDPTKTKVVSVTTNTDRFTVDYSYMEPGQPVYIKARSGVKLSDAENEYALESYDYGSFTNTLKATAQVCKAELSTNIVTSDSVQLAMSTYGGGLYTGWELQKQEGKGWKELTKTTSAAYTDKKLKPHTEYTYRTRTYYYSTKTKKTTYGKWETLTTMTWGGNLYLVVTASGKTSAKLKWNKIKGADGYEVYHRVTNSSSYYTTSLKNGPEEAFSKYELLANVKKTTYNAKKLQKGNDEVFYVRAYKTVNGRKYFIQSAVSSVCLDFDNLHIMAKKKQKNGSLKVMWNPVYLADGYQIDKKDLYTEEWVPYKTIKKTKTCYATLPASATETESYRIRAFQNGKPKKYSKYNGEITVDPFLKAPTGVKAKVLSDGSVQVNWKAVQGADYYQVFRVVNPQYTYDKDSGEYDVVEASDPIPWYIPDAASKIGYRRAIGGEEIKGTSFIDRNLVYKKDTGVEVYISGPEPGVEYYYYVVAYKNLTTTKRVINAKDNNIISSADSKPAKACVALSTKSRTLKAPKLSKISAKKTKVTLSWKKVEGAESYVIYRSTKKKKGYAVVGYAENGKTSFKDTNVEKGVTYYYKVKAAVKNNVGLDVVSKSTSAVKAVKVKGKSKGKTK